MKTRNFVAICGMVATLAACSGGPSDSDLRDALKAQIDQQISLMQGLPGGQAMADRAKQETQKNLDKIHLANCQKADAGGYRCDLTGGNGSATSIRMIKVDGKWAIAE